MAKEKPPQPEKDSDAAVVDRLLRKLPYADAKKVGRGATAGGTTSGGRRLPISGPVGGGVGEEELTARDKLGVWARVGLGLVIAIGMTQWPYAHDCGFKLLPYLTGVVSIVVAGGLASLFSWKRRMSYAHLASLGIVLWGLVMMSGLILPRVGYAQAQATWRCHAVAAEPAAQDGATGSPADAATAGEGAPGIEAETTEPAADGGNPPTAGTPKEAVQKREN